MSKRYQFVLFAVLIGLGPLFLPAADRENLEPPARNPQPNASRYTFREQHSRDGVGKFYMGREIAYVMGHQAADWLERPEREEEEKTDLLVRSLGIKSGQVVGDIGAGTGYFSRRLSKLVGENGKILAVDIQPEMLDLLTNTMAGLKITNVKPILGTIDNPNLPSNTVDLVLMVDVYHEFSHPFEMMQNICKSLKPDGRVAFVEFRGEDPNVPIKPLHKMTEAQVRKEMSVQSLQWVETIEVLPRQHIVVFKNKRLLTRSTTNLRPDGRFYFVGGEVKVPNRQQYTGPATVLRAIETAGGFTDFANKRKVQLRRADGEVQIVDCTKAAQDAKLDLLVDANDQVFIPKKSPFSF